MKFIEYFSALGFSPKEAEIYLALYKLGTQPASTVAKYIELERTYVYKALMDFARKDLVAVTNRWGVKYFFIPDISVLKHYVVQEESRLEKVRKEYDAVAVELQSHRKNTEHNAPKITLYDGAEGIKACYNDIYMTLEKTGYRSCRLFASNTLASRSGKSSAVDIYASEFFSKMGSRGYMIDTTLGNGILLMETVGRIASIDDLRELPATGESIQVFITGENVSLIIFREIPFGIKISSNELAHVFHFLLENLK